VRGRSLTRRFFSVRFPLSLTGGLAAFLLVAPSAPAGPPSEDLAAKARQGKEAMAAGRFDEAAALYAAIVQALPREPGMLLNLGMALSMAGRPRDALPPLEAALRLRPDLLPASLFLGTAHVDLGEPALAVEPLQTFVAAQPRHQEARRMLADSLLSLERHESAAREYRTLSEQAAQDPRAWYGLGRSYEGLAQDAFAELQRDAPESVYMLLLVAESMTAQERDKSAFRLYREALAKRPDLPEAREAVARIYERNGHPDWAMAEREKAGSYPPRECGGPSLECDFRAKRHQAVVDAAPSARTTEGRYWRARAAGELAHQAFAHLDALPSSPEATLVRVEILRGQRRYLESKEELQKAVSAWPEDRRIRKALASLHFIAHEYTEARPILEELLKEEPGSAELCLLLGETWLESKEPRKAIPFLEDAVKRDPKLTRARGALGRAYLDAGDAERAIAPLQAALETDEEGSLHFQLSRAYRATGRAEEAGRMLEKFQEIRRANEVRAQSEKEEFAITKP
jgi:tetratricopeptide (TPR) repeat protein